MLPAAVAIYSYTYLHILMYLIDRILIPTRRRLHIAKYHSYYNKTSEATLQDMEPQQQIIFFYNAIEEVATETHYCFDDSMLYCYTEIYMFLKAQSANKYLPAGVHGGSAFFQN
jgi:hypothetical protein